MTIEQMTIIVKALAILLGVIVTSVIRPAIESYVGKDKLNEYVNYIKVAIRCAEQIFTKEQWAEKKDYVYSFAIDKAKEMNVSLTEKDIDILIEGFVNEIKGN